VLVYEPSAEPRAAAIILGGANCAAWRYDRLATALARSGLFTIIADVPERTIPNPAGGMRTILAIGFDNVAEAAEEALKRARQAPRFLIGHSFGGTLALELFDPAALEANPTYRQFGAPPPLPPIAGIVTLGSHVQATFMGRPIPYRSEDKMLPMPAHMRLLHIAGSNDGICPPDQVWASARRFPTPSLFLNLAGANHFSWTDAVGAKDALAADGLAAAERPVFIARTAAAIAAFAMADNRIEPMEAALRPTLALDDALRIGGRGGGS
jgi:pimeloyl-ACP methyl ester carboxylesterase